MRRSVVVPVLFALSACARLEIPPPPPPHPLPGPAREEPALSGEIVVANPIIYAALPASGHLGETITTVFLLETEMQESRENYAHREDAGFRRVAVEPLSTFAIDVDTASYSNVRRFLTDGRQPPPDAVRIEELLNYFVYDDPLPVGGEPFSVSTEVGACPWEPGHRLLRIGLRAAPIEFMGRRPGNYIFLVDVSGSMNEPEKLPLVQESLRMLAGQLTGSDRVSIVVYAGAAGVVLPPTSGSDRGALEEAIDAMQAGGSTAGGEGIQLAYDIARENLVPGGINRVILATDGDFNVGPSSDGELVRLIEEQAATGVFLTVLGFGTGNLQDAKLEALADRGNGQYAYIDSELEARRALVEQAGGTLATVASDVKMQVEFNPAQVEAYRLIGYENRLLAAGDFRDDAKDAGEIGAGHSVIALYELVPASREAHDDPTLARPLDPLRYQVLVPNDASASGELATVKLRFRPPEGGESVEREVVVRHGETGRTPDELRFAAAVAAFGMVLRDSPFRGSATLEISRQLAESSIGSDPDGQRAAFVRLVDRAREVVRERVAAR